MTFTVTALAAPAAGATFERTTIERRDLRPHDVRIEIDYAGVCHSDVHQVLGEWGNAFFPMVPGHELVGRVVAIGGAVTRHAVGDRVGVGCMVDSCRTCENCVAGQEQYCLRGEVQAYNHLGYDDVVTLGAYSTDSVVDEAFVVRVPESLSGAGAAPLLCAGITLFSALREWGAGPGTRVAIIGLGGLGHVGVQIAAALGASTTALGHSLAKRDDGLRLGAEAFFATGDPATFTELERTFDLVINTTSVNLELDTYLSLLKTDGTFVNVGIPTQPDQVAMWSLAQLRRRLAASKIGGIAETQEMLDFCAEHGIEAQVEIIEPGDIDEAYTRLVASDVRYRFVLDVAGLRRP